MPIAGVSPSTRQASSSTIACRYIRAATMSTRTARCCAPAPMDAMPARPPATQGVDPIHRVFGAGENDSHHI